MSKQSRKFKVPDELANLYDFANTLDVRCFTHNRVQHLQRDELANSRELGSWMSQRGLLFTSARITPEMFANALQLRAAIRAFLEHDPGERAKDRDVLGSLNKASALFPLVAEERGGSRMTLRGVRSDALAGLSAIVAEFYQSSINGTLPRLKMCASEECRRVFFDRSKPASRRWCMSTLCGNRMKTRTYRERHRNID